MAYLTTVADFVRRALEGDEAGDEACDEMVERVMGHANDWWYRCCGYVEPIPYA